MPARWHKFVHLLQLTRVALVFTAVSNVWLVIFLSYGLVEGPGHRSSGLDEYPLWAMLILGAAVAAGLHTYGIALNDFLDARHDRLFSPHRPIPAGGVGSVGAVVVSLVSLLLALTAGVFMGKPSSFLCLLAAGAILFYNTVGKFFPASGILTLALLRPLLMLAANPRLSFAWPLWLTMTHVLVCWGLAYQLEGKRPRLRAAEWWVLCGGWAAATLGLVQAMNLRGGRLMPPAGSALPAPLWVLPLGAVGLFAVLAYRRLAGQVRSARLRRQAGAGFLRLALLWLIVYDAAWLEGAGLHWQAAVSLGLFVLAYASMRLLLVLGHLAQPAPTFNLGPQRERGA